MVTANRKPVVLLGFMGSGKSTLGKQVAVSLGYLFVDLDQFIESRERRSIQDIFDRDGESVFREMEARDLKEILGYSGQVVAVGGGAPCHGQNMELIREKAISVYLKVSDQELGKRLLASNTQRPLLAGRTPAETLGLIRKLNELREPFYRLADIVIESDTITAEMILSELEKL